MKKKEKIMKLKDYLTEHGLKKTYFAKKIGIHPLTLSRILRTNMTSQVIANMIHQLTKGQVGPLDFIIR